jgi:hypothetical protein
MKKMTVLALLLTLFCYATVAQDSVGIATHRMASTGVFAFGGVGFAGRISDGEKDFKVIVALPPAAALDTFERLYAVGNSEAKSYALVGIRRLDLKRFDELKKLADDSQETVLTMRGCILERRALKDVALEIERGNYDSWARSQ